MRGLASKTKELIRYARQLLEADHPQTLRQLHYAIFSRREITYENCQADYRRLGRAMSYARRLYRAWELEYVDGAALAIAQPYAIPGRWIVDESRQPEIVNVFQNASEYVGVVKRAYRRDAWQDQPAYCEVWSEKEPSSALFGRLPTSTAPHFEFATGSAVQEWKGKLGKCSQG